MAGLWERIVGWFGGENETESADVVSVDLVTGLREAANDLYAVRREIAAAAKARPDDDFSQARLLLASATVLELIADTLTDSIVGNEGETTEGWRARHAEALYRSLLGLLEKVRVTIAHPPQKPTPIRDNAVLPSKKIALDADVIELMRLNDRLRAHHDADIAYARASRPAAEQMRLNELLGLLRSRANIGRLLPPAGGEQASAGSRDALGRMALGELLSLWFLVGQELVIPNITADLLLGPELTSTGNFAAKYAPDNVWMMTDPVAKAHYKSAGTLEDLAEDIRFEVLRGQPFSRDDIAFAQQIDWLEQTEVVTRLASYWVTSPHPTIYRAKEAGELSFSAGKVTFAKGDRMVWLCQMGMEMANAEFPVLVGDMQSSSVRQLCGDMQNAMMGAKMKRGGMARMP